MEDNIGIIRKYERLILIAIPLLMAVAFAFLPVIDIFGKTTANGVELIFDVEGFGFVRFCATMSLVLPVIALYIWCVTSNLRAKIAKSLYLICVSGSLIFVILMAINLPDRFSLAWGGYVYGTLTIIGIFFAFLLRR